MPTYYQVLGITTDASHGEIRRAFRNRAKDRHPDTAGGTQSAMVALNEAYETLRDPRRRSAYDATLAPAGRVGRAPAADAGALIDPRVFLLKVFAPMDARVVAAAARLETAIAELAYDIYDDTYLARFSEVLEAAERDISGVEVGLRTHVWPTALTGALHLYGQGLRMIEDAMADFDDFTQNFDVDVLALAREIMDGGLDHLEEARARML